MTGMETRLSGKIDQLESNVAQNRQSIVLLTDSVNKNTVDLARLEAQMLANEGNFERRVAEIARNCNNGDPQSVVPLSTPLSTEQVQRYWRCRRSLRFWPVSGPDLVESVRDFLRSNLGYTNSTIEQDVGDFDVRKVVEPRSKIKNEVVAEFSSSSIRDFIKGQGFKLEGKRAGIRIEVPHHLKSDFHVLQNLSYKLKMANKDMKRSIKFDDECCGMMLDIQMAGQDWRRIRPDQARAARRSDPSLRSGPLELTGDMITGAMNASGALLSGSNATPLGGSPNTED